MRMVSNEELMRKALEVAQTALKSSDVPVGAVVVDSSGEIIGSGFNRRELDKDPSAHAEIQVMRKAAKILANYRLVDCTLYVTLEPCVMCAGAIQHARIGQLVYGAHDPKTGACGSVVNLMTEEKLNHHTEVIAGILAEPCGEMLSQFFKRRRKN